MKEGVLVWLFNFVVRGILGMGVIYFVNVFLDSQELVNQVGLNLVTFFTSGALGIPGVALLYGIRFFQML